MSDRDFFREVDEAVRHDRYKELWDKYGLYALVAATLIVAGVAGFKAWTYWQERKSQEAGTEFSQALGALDGGDAAKANSALNDLAEKGPAGYRVLARFQIAAAEAQAGNTDKAVALYDALAADSGDGQHSERACHDSGGHAPARRRRLRGDGAAPEGSDRAGEPLEIFGAGAARAFGLPVEQDSRMPKSNSARSSPIRERPRTYVSAPT